MFFEGKMDGKRSFGDVSTDRGHSTDDEAPKSTTIGTEDVRKSILELFFAENDYSTQQKRSYDDFIREGVARVLSNVGEIRVFSPTDSTASSSFGSRRGNYQNFGRQKHSDEEPPHCIGITIHHETIYFDRPRVSVINKKTKQEEEDGLFHNNATTSSASSSSPSGTSAVSENNSNATSKKPSALPLMYPKQARLSSMTYETDFFCDVTMRKYHIVSSLNAVGAIVRRMELVQQVLFKKCKLGSIPVMVRSMLCNLSLPLPSPLQQSIPPIGPPSVDSTSTTTSSSSLPQEERAQGQKQENRTQDFENQTIRSSEYERREINLSAECEYDGGGYFVIQGQEKMVISQERLADRRVFIFATTKTGKQQDANSESKNSFARGGGGTAESGGGGGGEEDGSSGGAGSQILTAQITSRDESGYSWSKFTISMIPTKQYLRRVQMQSKRAKRAKREEQEEETVNDSMSSVGGGDGMNGADGGDGMAFPGQERGGKSRMSSATTANRSDGDEISSNYQFVSNFVFVCEIQGVTTQPILLSAFLRALGMSDDREFIAAVAGGDPCLAQETSSGSGTSSIFDTDAVEREKTRCVAAVLEDTLLLCSEQGLCHRANALAHLCDRMKIPQRFSSSTSTSTLPSPAASKTKKNGTGTTLQRLQHYLLYEFFPHIDTKDAANHTSLQNSSNNQHEITRKNAILLFKKRIFINYMMERLLCVYLGQCPLDSRDKFQDKRILQTGSLLEMLFKNAMARWSKKITEMIQKIMQDRRELVVLHLIQQNTDILRETFRHALGTGNWVGGAAGVSQTLSVVNHIARASTANRMRSALNVANAKSKPRQLSGNMWGKTCPAETPEGLHIGIDKNAAIATHFSLQGDKQTLIECLQQISRSYALYFALSSSLSSLSRTMFLCKIMVNGDWIGGTAVPQRLIRDFKTARRTPLRWNGAIPLDASITFDPISNTIEIFCDAGRPCRPLLIVDSENSRSLASSTSAHHHHHQKPCRLILQYEHISSLLAEHLKRKSTHHQTGEEEQKKKKKEQEENVSVVDGSEKNKLQKLSRHQKASSSSSSSLMKKIRNWTDLFRYGILEFVDACEEEISLIATFPEDLVSNEQQTRPLYYTHCEIHPSTILGIAASTIPFSNHNQSPRNTYQSAMIKQAQGVLSTRESARCTTESFELWYGQRPIVLTQAGRALNMVNMPCTVNAIIAIACFGGYNQEDAILMNQSSVDRGFARSYYRRTYSDQCHEIRNKSGQNMVYMFANASVISKIGMTMPNGVFVRETVQGMRGNYDKLDIDGTPMQGMRFKKGDVIIGKVYEICIASSSSGGETHNYGSQQQLKPMNSVITLDSSKSVPMGGTTVYAKRTIHDCSTVWPLEMDGVCETVIRTVNAQGTPIIKATFRCMCIPQIGDKFAAMPGQKGVIGMMYRQEDMLYSAKDGTPVDIILNPHAIPSRMTIGTLIEGLGCKVAFLKGMELDATPFANTTSSEGMVAQLSAILHELGYESRGTEKLIHPHTGIPMEAAIFFGAMQYQRLRHMVDFKIQSRQRGPVDPLTRQPMQGKKRDGGGRFGEMERDATLAHGAMAMVRDRLLLNSDHYRVPVCENCGSIVSVVASRKSPSQQRQHTNLGAFNENIKNVKCNSAKCSKTIGVIEWSWIVLPYAMYLLHMELLAMGLRMKFGTRPTTV